MFVVQQDLRKTQLYARFKKQDGWCPEFNNHGEFPTREAAQAHLDDILSSPSQPAPHAPWRIIEK